MVIIELKSTNSLYTKWQASIKSAIILGNFARRTSFRCGVTRQTITSIEVEKYNASLVLAYKIAKYFGTTIEEIFDFSEVEEI